MPVTLDDQVSLRTAYLIMHTFAVRYWERGQKADELTDFIVDTAVFEDETPHPVQFSDWLSAAEEVLSKRPARTGFSHEPGEAAA